MPGDCMCVSIRVAPNCRSVALPSRSRLGKDNLFINLGEPLDTHKERFFTLGSRALGLFSMYLVKHSFQRLLERLVFGALVEFTHEVAPNFECLVAELQGRAAEVLYPRHQ